ncbi:DNA polymerase III subunit gamma/tau [Allocoleopsis franciscana]|uniref:DNA polymerase III subunit gamma/tau n=1 Tax=Allocoleopsis franciscana TaxID=2886352 RepID=UPI000900500E|nr:DNA polymerase III subunit gamma/tau [Allocoleopsis franciscana]
MSYEPLHHKYRPQTFADLVGQEAIATTLTNAILSERIAPAYLFTGPRGTGKTSSARILAKSLNCLKQDQPTESPCGYCDVCKSIASGAALDVIEIDAASNTGVDNIREIIERAQFAPVQCRYKVYVVDECHMLSTAAFNALLKTLEEPPKHVVFVLATTDPQRVLPTIISRCQRFDFRRIPLDAMVGHLRHISSQEQIDITPEALTLVAQVAQGGLRDAESLLDQLSLLPEKVAVEHVWDLVGAVPERDLMALTKALSSDNSEAVLDHCRRLMDKGREPLIVLQNLAGFYRDLLIAKTAPNRNDLVAVTPPTWEQLREFAKSLDISTILQGQQHLKNSEAQIKNTTQPRLWLEVTLLGLLKSANPTPVASPPVLQTPAMSRQEPQTSRESSSSSAPLHSASSSGASSPDRSTQSNSVAQEQSFSSQNPTTARREEIPSIPVQSPTANASAANSTASTQSLAGNAAKPTPEAIASSSNVNEIWQKVLSVLQPFATQALLRQHCHLLSFEESIAYVGVSSLPLLDLAQKKLPNIEAAFERVYQSKVKVTLQTKAMNSSHTATADKSTVQPIVKPTPELKVTQPLTNDTFNQGTRQVLSVLPEGEKAPEVYAKTGREGENTALLEKTNFPIHQEPHGNVITEAPVPLPSIESPQSLLVESIDVDAGEIEKALGNLKLFFDGEIVDLSDDASKREPASIPSWELKEGIEEATQPLALEQAQEDDQDKTPLIQAATHYQWQEDELTALQNSQISKRLEELELDEDGDIPF